MNFFQTMLSGKDNKSIDVSRVSLLLVILTLCVVTIICAWRNELAALNGFLVPFGVCGASLIYGAGAGISVKAATEPTA
jgi:hypothetical protein